MDQGTTRKAAALVAVVLAAVVVSGAVVGTRDVRDALEPDVAAAVEATAPDQVGFEVTGREVSIDPWAAPAGVVSRAVRAVEAVPGVRSVEVRPVVVGASEDEASGDVDLTVETTATGIVFSGAVPSRALADEIGDRVSQVRALPVAVDLAVDPSQPRPQWWPGLGDVLDVTGQVAGLGIQVRDGRVEVTGTTAGAAAATRITEQVEDVPLAGGVRASITPGGTALDERDADVVEDAVIVFDVGGDTLTRAGRRALDDVADALRGTDVVLEVVGKSGWVDASRREALATRRSEAVRTYLVSQGVAPDHLVVAPNVRAGLAEPDPRSTWDRRVQFRVEEER